MISPSINFRCPHSLITFLLSFSATAAYGFTWSLTVTVEILWASILNNRKSFKVFSWICFLKTRLNLRNILFFLPQQLLCLLVFHSCDFICLMIFEWFILCFIRVMCGISKATEKICGFDPYQHIVQKQTSAQIVKSLCQYFDILPIIWKYLNILVFFKFNLVSKKVWRSICLLITIWRHQNSYLSSFKIIKMD